MRVFAIKRNGEFVTNKGTKTKTPRLYNLKNHVGSAQTYWIQNARSEDVKRCMDDLLQRDGRANKYVAWSEYQMFCNECFPPIEEYAEQYSIVTYDLVEVIE